MVEEKTNMLTKFEVTNYMGFQNKIVFDLNSHKKYDFNKNFVEKKIVKKSLVYGPNGSGKSSLCSAIMDITYHLVDKEKIAIPNWAYFNAGMQNQKADFTYTFKFGKNDVVYSYCKLSQSSLAYEKLSVNGQKVLGYNYIDESENINRIPEAQNLNMRGLSQQLSAIKYIGANTNLPADSPIRQLIDFVNGMLLFKSLANGNSYMGYKMGGESLSDIIIRNNKIPDFQLFLEKFGLHYELVPLQNAFGGLDLGVRFPNKNVVSFMGISSSGTKALTLFYCWSLEFDKLSFLIVDEFDAYYQYQTARQILSVINSHSNFQSLITTHNLTLMDNEMTRPDCCFILNDGEIRPLSSLTKKEIRKTNNLEKMYRDGQFTDFMNKEPSDINE